MDWGVQLALLFLLFCFFFTFSTCAPTRRALLVYYTGSFYASWCRFCPFSSRRYEATEGNRAHPASVKNILEENKTLWPSMELLFGSQRGRHQQQKLYIESVSDDNHRQLHWRVDLASP
jgi:hypothetical protein